MINVLWSTGMFQGSLGLNSVSNFTILASDNPYGVFQISESFRPVQVDEQYKSKLITYFTLWEFVRV